MAIQFNVEQCSDLQFLRSREWLVTNGIDGYASSTIAGMNTRRYHGLLVAATAPPLGRLVLLSQLEDILVVEGARFSLGTNLYAGDVVAPHGYLHLIDFHLDPNPVFTGHGEWRVTKKIWMGHDQNATVIEYILSRTNRRSEVFLEVRPLIAFRDYHGTTHESETLNRTVEQGDGEVSIQPYASLPRLHLSHGAATVQVDGYWYRRLVYKEERRRGLDHTEDLFSPLALRACLSETGSFRLIASTEPVPVTMVEQPRDFARIASFGRGAGRRGSLAFYFRQAPGRGGSRTGIGNFRRRLPALAARMYRASLECRGNSKSCQTGFAVPCNANNRIERQVGACGIGVST